MESSERHLRPPAQHVFTKTDGHKVFFDEGDFDMRRRVLCSNDAFLLSSAKRYLNCTNRGLAEIFRVARRTLMNAVPKQSEHIAQMGQEAQHMKAKDAEAFVNACIQPLRNQIVEEIESMGDFSILERMAKHGTEALVSRANFFEHVLPCAKQVFPDALYRQWIDFLLEFSHHPKYQNLKQ